MLGELDGVAVCGLKVHDYLVARGSADLRCGGVGAVATMPEARGKGFGTQFMVDALREMRDAGHVISNLYAFREPSYRNAGYATCGWRWRIKAPQSRLAKTEQSLDARQLTPDEIQQVDECYTKFVRTFSGSVLRTDHQWKNRLPKKQPMIYAVGDPIEAYAWVKLKDFWGDVEVGELAWISVAGYDSIMAVLRNLAVNQSHVVWREPPTSPLLASNLDQGVEMKLDEPTMYRVLDVPGALAALVPECTGAFSIEVSDEQLPENRGPWRVAFSPDGVIVEPCDSADLVMDIRQFSQALMGLPSLIDIATTGLLEAKSDTVVDEAAKLLTAMPVCCMEFF